MSQAPRIALLGPYGYYNMGDATLVEAAKQGLRRQIADVEFIGVCANPVLALERHSMPAYSLYSDFQPETPDAPSRASPPTRAPLVHLKAVARAVPGLIPLLKGLRRTVRYASFVRRNYQLLKTVDLVVMPGSGQLHEEWHGPWRYLYALFSWLILARLAGCKTAFLSIGAGSFSTRWGRIFARNALRHANYVSCRDPETLAKVASLGLPAPPLKPDLAFGMRWKNLHPTLGPDAPRGKGVVGINPIAYADPRFWFDPDPARYAAYLGKLIGMTEWLVQQGYRVMFIPNETRGDKRVIDDILRQLGPATRAYVDAPLTNSADELVNHLAACDIVVAARFHGAVFSYLLRKPVLTLAFHYKLTMLARDMGCDQYCMDIASFSLDEFQARFLELEAERAAAVERIGRAQACYLDELDKQYALVAGLAREARRRRAPAPVDNTMSVERGRAA